MTATPKAAPSGPVLFEALCTPPSSLSGRGLLLVGALLGLGLTVSGLLFLALGAWPVLGFTGGETVLVAVLLALYRRWSRRAMELVVLTEERLTIRRTDARGRPEELVMDPYWTRLHLEERPGIAPALTLRQRDRAVEVGRLLGEAEKRDLAQALAGALQRYREPVFDNPQLREG